MIRRTIGHFSRRAVAAGLVSALSLALLGGFAILSTTSLGCGPAARLGLSGISSHCKPTASLVPLASPSPAALPSAGPSPEANPTSAYSPPVSAPYSPPVSEPYAPPVSEPYPPDNSPVSSPYPPYFPLAPSGNATTALNCKLPVFDEPVAGQFHGGFVQFPGGNFVADPAASALSAPTGTVQGGLTYDRTYSRWLPVPPTWVSADGSRYAYLGSDGMHVVTVATGSDATLGKSSAGHIVHVGLTGVYAAQDNQPGLWLLTYSGAVQQITQSGYWDNSAATDIYAYATNVYPSLGVGSSPIGDKVIRVDLQTGAVTDWFTRDGTISSVIGLDAQGNPLIYAIVAYTPTFDYWIATGPADAYPIFGSSGGPGTVSGAIADAHGLWMLSTVGIVLFVPGSGVYAMSSVATPLAGTCN